MAKKQERKVVVERNYIIPLRRSTDKVARYKKAKKAIKTIREFLARHMKVPERNVKKIKIDKWLNMAVWHRGIKNPPSKIHVKAKKYNDDIVEVELAELPKKARIAKEREEEERKKAAERKKADETKKGEQEKAKAEEEKAKAEGKKEEGERAEKLKEEERLLQKIRKTEHEMIKPKKEVHRRMALEK